jgi:hypothetical protein
LVPAPHSGAGRIVIPSLRATHVKPKPWTTTEKATTTKTMPKTLSAPSAPAATATAASKIGTAPLSPAPHHEEPFAPCQRDWPEEAKTGEQDREGADKDDRPELSDLVHAATLGLDGDGSPLPGARRAD